jgi:hypothetical protein
MRRNGSANVSRESFGKSHRVGYARRYQHGGANNLVFEMQAGYNCDRDLD